MSVVRLLSVERFFCLALCLACGLGLGGHAWSQSDTAGRRPVRTKNSDASTEAWPRFLGAGIDGVASTDPASIDWQVPPRLLWSLPVGDGYGIGSVQEGRYFQCDTGPRAGVQIRERTRCLDLATGEEIWSDSDLILFRDMLGYDDGPRSSPTIDGDRVYTMGVTGILNCRDVKDGRVIWKQDTNQAYGVVQNFFGVGSAPLILDGRLIVMVGGSPQEDQDLPPMRLDRVNPNGSAVVGLDPLSGKELWRCGDDLASYSSPRPIRVGDETLVLVFARTGLLAIDPVAGKVRWRFHHRAEVLESVNGMVPVVEGSHVFLSECYEVGSVLLDASGASPRVVWQDPMPNRDFSNQAMRCHWATPVLIDGFLYGGSGRNAPDSNFRCVDFMTGKVQWSDSRQVRSSVTRVGDRLLVLEERGKLQIVRANPKELDVITTWDLGESAGKRPALSYPCWSAPVLVGRKLIVRGTEKVLCLELAAAK
ncbi:MAG: PQQ-binding-like beta-propeller repeat protein [Rubripirellula sp.]